MYSEQIKLQLASYRCCREAGFGNYTTFYVIQARCSKSRLTSNHNEVVNRSQPSPASALAWQNIVNAVFSRFRFPTLKTSMPTRLRYTLERERENHVENLLTAIERSRKWLFFRFLAISTFFHSAAMQSFRYRGRKHVRR